MKKFIYRHNEKYHLDASIRIMKEILSHIPNNKKVLDYMYYDVKYLMRSGPGVYYVSKEHELDGEVVSSDVCHYFYIFRIQRRQNKFQNLLIPRIPKTVK